MLDDAIAAFLDSVSERAFDEPLLALLRAQGYTDVHLIHGAREFGKDVIGRKEGEQWGLQSKAGDIGQSEWRALVGQLDELRLVNLGHGSFDTRLPRRSVLVTTGRLTGNSPDLYRDYNERARERGEPELGLWDRDELLGRLSGNPDAVLRGELDGQLLAAVGSADERTATMMSIEIFSRRWTAWKPHQVAGLGVIEAALLAEHLKQTGRLDLSCHVGLCLVRGALAASVGASAQGEVAAAAAGALFEAYALELWEQCDDRLLRERDLAGLSGPSSWVTTASVAPASASCWACSRCACGQPPTPVRMRSKSGWSSSTPHSLGSPTQSATSTRSVSSRRSWRSRPRITQQHVCCSSA